MINPNSTCLGASLDVQVESLADLIEKALIYAKKISRWVRADKLGDSIHPVASSTTERLPQRMPYITLERRIRPKDIW
jgi:hypothetical protein